MKYLFPTIDFCWRISRPARRFCGKAMLGASLFLVGFATGAIDPGYDHGQIGQTPSNFEIALKQNQTALFERKGSPDVALYNIGLILSHPSNPRKDQPKALHSFKTLVTDHPRSPLVNPAKTWIQVLEQQQKNAEERQRLADEKRTLAREREMLLQERQKLNYANERSQQLDVEIDKRRRQSLSK